MCKLYGPWACTHWTDSPYEPDKADPKCNGQGANCLRFEKVRQPRATVCMKCALKSLEMQAVAKMAEEDRKNGDMEGLKEDGKGKENVKAKLEGEKAKNGGGKVPKTRKERKVAEEMAKENLREGK